MVGHKVAEDTRSTSEAHDPHTWDMGSRRLIKKHEKKTGPTVRIDRSTVGRKGASCERDLKKLKIKKPGKKAS